MLERWLCATASGVPVGLAATYWSWGQCSDDTQMALLLLESAIHVGPTASGEELATVYSQRIAAKQGQFIGLWKVSLLDTSVCVYTHIHVCIHYTTLYNTL